MVYNWTEYGATFLADSNPHVHTYNRQANVSGIMHRCACWKARVTSNESTCLNVQEEDGLWQVPPTPYIIRKPKITYFTPGSQHLKTKQM